LIGTALVFPNEKISFFWETNSFLCKPIVWRHQYGNIKSEALEPTGL